jgi:two-component system response regulator DevR
MVDLFIADERDVVRRGFGQLLSLALDLRVVGEAATAAQLRRRVAVTHPQVVIGTPALMQDTFQVVAEPETDAFAWIVQVPPDGRPPDVIEHGVAITGTESVSELQRLVRRVALGRTRSHAPGENDAGSAGEAEDARLAALNRRERDVLACMATGKTNREVGAVLGLSEKTVKNYITGLFAKLGVRHRTEAIVIMLGVERPSAVASPATAGHGTPANGAGERT